jgi:aldose 1-epimerase
MEATTRAWGTLSGRSIERTTLTNANGMSLSLTNYGATVLSVLVPSRGGGPASEVTLCHTNLEDLRAHSPYFGCTVGRVANRIALGKYSVDGKAYSAPVNNGPNALHGGVTGFDKVVWDATTYCTPSAAGVRFTYVSKDGEEGYPGTLTATADYRLTEANEVRMEFTATTDAPTPVNLCNHTYWNLSGDLRSNVHDHVMQLHMPLYTPIDASCIPTGEVAPVKGTHFDFTTPTRIGERIMGVDGGGAPGYDHNYVRSATLPSGGFSHGLHPIARVTEATSGRSMEVESNAPGVQFYTVRWGGGGVRGLGPFFHCSARALGGAPCSFFLSHLLTSHALPTNTPPHLHRPAPPTAGQLAGGSRKGRAAQGPVPRDPELSRCCQQAWGFPRPHSSPRTDLQAHYRAQVCVVNKKRGMG